MADPLTITDVHQLIAETLASGGPVADELDAASEVLDALYCAGVTLRQAGELIEWPDADYHCPDGDPPEADTDEDEDRCPHCGSEPDDTMSHRDDCPTLGTCAQTDPEMEPPWHPEAEWTDGNNKNWADDLKRHLSEAHGQTR